MYSVLRIFLTSVLMQHAAMTLVCSDDELDVVNVGNEEKRDAPVESNSTVR